MDFYRIIERTPKKDTLEISPDFIVKRSKDFMVRGNRFYAIWDSERQLWSTDEYDVQRLVDDELEKYYKQRREQYNGTASLKRLSNFSSNMWNNYKYYLKQMIDNSHQLDESLTFSNTQFKKTDYVSRTLPYPLEEGPIDAYDELMSTLYDPEERAKLEWAIGAIVSGDSKNIEKFIVLYGDPGSGKSTFLNIVQKLFVGYYIVFDAKSLTSNNDSFSMEIFKSNPLVAIQHDGDLSRIEDNTRLNSITSHEEMSINEKFKSKYTSRINCFLFMGTNKPVKITDAKSGIIRRLIDVNPSLRLIPNKKYHILTSQIDFELGAIAYHCLQVYRSMGKNYYSTYKPLAMMMKTDVFFNFIEEYYHIFKEQEGVTLKQAYTLYKTYCEETLIEFKLPMYKFREELKSYFSKFDNVTRIGEKQIRSYYSGFIADKIFNQSKVIEEEKPTSLVLDSDKSILDNILADCQAQYVTENETPKKKWEKVTTKLSDIKTDKTHYVKVPNNHIVIDFDLKDEKGVKSFEKNIEAASKWPSTYAETSRSGCAIHLHYIYDGDVETLSRIYSQDIEIKVFTGNSALRRKLTKCNNISVATINSGLPLKGDKKMINFDSVQSEKGLRTMIARNLNKEIHPGTKPSIDFIHKILEDAYKAGISYDVTDMRPTILTFANNSSNQADYCVKLVSRMKFASEETIKIENDENTDLIFYDVEVFPNLFVLVWKKAGLANNFVKMINPKPQAIESILKLKLVGFNCRRYDNHIIYAAYLGYTNLELYDLSQKLINNSRSAMFGEAYGISYTDVYDFSSAVNKKSLKKWEIELGIHHMELGLNWDEPVPEELWDKVADYCCNDVSATEAVFFCKPIQDDWAARQILAALSGLTLNDTTNQHAARIVFGNNKKPQSEFIYTDLSTIFPGYTFENGISTYRGIKVGEGGYVYAEPAIYSNVAVLDVTSMHPTSIRNLNMFGPYTKNYNDLTDGRVAIKHKDYDTLKTLFDGKIWPFVDDALGENPKFTLKGISTGLKTGINSPYGLTFASFDNPFRDPRNMDNIVAKRGALFMIELQHLVQEKGFTVAHIKTDSIKIPNATPEIIDFVFEVGKRYGYEFEHEETFQKFCLVNDAVFIAKKEDGTWTPTGAQFAHPYVFKTLFSKEPIVLKDMCETKSVTTALYLDMNEHLQEDEHDYHFVGKVGSFCPIKPGCGGGVLLRIKDDKYYAATGSKGYRWLEAELVKELGKEDDIDRDYYIGLVDAAIKDISAFGDFEWFLSDETEPIPDEPIGFNDQPPWLSPCGKSVPCNDCHKYPNCGCLPF